MIAFTTISAVKSKPIDNNIVNDMPNLVRQNRHKDFDDWMIANNTYNNVHVVLSSISAIHDPAQLHDNVLERRNVGTFATNIGSTTVGSNSPYIWEVETVSLYDSDSDSGNFSNDDDDDATITDWDSDFLDEFDINLNEMKSSLISETASKPTGVTANNLRKIRRIDAKTADKTLNITTQLLRWSQDSTSSRNYTTGYRMLRYKRIDQ